MSEPEPETETETESEGVAASLLAELEADGEFVDAGGFQLDSIRARDKLRDYQLADAHGYALLLVEAAVLAGVEAVEVELDGGLLRVGLGPIRFRGPELEHLFAAAFIGDGEIQDEDTRRRRLVLHKLAIACNAALRLEPRAVEIDSLADDGILRLRLARDAEAAAELEQLDLDAASLGEHGAVVRVDHGLRTGQVARVAELIRERCRFSPVTVKLDGEQIDMGLEHAFVDADSPGWAPRPRKLRPVTLGDRPLGLAGLRYGSEAPAELILLSNGVLAERFEFGDPSRPAAPDFTAILDLDLRKDLAQARFLRGLAFDEVLDAVWSAHDAIAPEDFGPPRREALPEVARNAWIAALIPVVTAAVGLTLIVWDYFEPGEQAGGWGWALLVGTVLITTFVHIARRD